MLAAHIGVGISGQEGNKQKYFLIWFSFDCCCCCIDWLYLYYFKYVLQFVHNNH